ncbi:MAG: hypothetical protein ACW96X_02200 [Promethearchaeota archaeon]|jgi:hypothetical protein
MVQKIWERRSILENSIRLLESILSNYEIQKESKPVSVIQNRIRSYKHELKLSKD